MNNIIHENAINTAITKNTTLGELLAIIGPVSKEGKTPTAKKLREEIEEPIAVADCCLVYSNGYAVYDNGSGRTVLWLPSCVSFTYHFNPMKESEKGGDIKKTCELSEGILESQPWPIAVMLIGEHRIEALVHHRKSDRKGNKSLIRGDNEESGVLKDMEERGDSLRKEYTWHEGRFGEDPLEYVIRKERQRETLKVLTDKQREVFILYFQEGYTQSQIAEKLGVSRDSINDRLEGALKKAKKFFP